MDTRVSLSLSVVGIAIDTRTIDGGNDFLSPRIRRSLRKNAEELPQPVFRIGRVSFPPANAGTHFLDCLQVTATNIYGFKRVFGVNG